MRRLPVYLLLDTSGSMRGEPIEAVKTGVDMLVGMLRQDPYALETVWLSIITFDREVKVLLPLTALDTAQIPEITTPESGPTHLGDALRVLCREVRRDVARNSGETKGDWRPLLFIMTDGSPSDIALYRETIPEVHSSGFGMIVGCAAGPKASVEILSEVAQPTVRLDTLEASGLKTFFTWVSASVSRGSQSQGTIATPELPPPPPELLMVV
jgi:uncharacterized protein YegL